MKNIARFMLATVAILAMFAISTSCSNDYKDMNPGEVRLDENDYRNDDRLQTVTYASPVEGAENETAQMSALEARTLWHSVIINAEKLLEEATDTEKNLYASPKEVEDAFFTQVSRSMSLLKEAYPLQYQALVDEFIRADVHVFAHYVWCAQPDEYIKLKFRATPSVEAGTPPTEDPDATPAE